MSAKQPCQVRPTLECNKSVYYSHVNGRRTPSSELDTNITPSKPLNVSLVNMCISLLSCEHGESRTTPIRGCLLGKDKLDTILVSILTKNLYGSWDRIVAVAVWSCSTIDEYSGSRLLGI